MKAKDRKRAPISKSDGYATWMPAIIMLILLLAIILLVQESSVIASMAGKNCGNGTQSGQCWGTYYCDNGALLYDADRCGCAPGTVDDNNVCRYYRNCTDGTPHDGCSSTHPLFCFDGVLTDNVSVCGCGPSEVADGNACRIAVNCSDGTADTDCSSDQPYYCHNGTLEEKASLCGCPAGTVQDNDRCEIPYMTDPELKEFPFTLDGQTYKMTTTLYGGLNDYLATQQGWEYSYYGNAPSPQELEGIYADQWVDQPNQDMLIDNLTNDIERWTSNKDDQARIAISIVQNIPYDWAEYYQSVDSNSYYNEKFPYQVLYTDAGICQDKSELLVLLLKKLGFGAALLEYDAQDHEAVGIACPAEYSQYSLGNTDYCFVESTIPTIVTDDMGTYLGGTGNITLGPPSGIIKMSDGRSFNASQEYADAQKEEELDAMPEPLGDSDYAEWVALVNRYGLIVDNSSITGSNGVCPAGATYCDRLCWPDCDSGSVPSCDSNGLECTLANTEQNCDGTWCQGQCYTPCPSGSSPECRPDGLHCVERR
jgi:hypothetical protein